MALIPPSSSEANNGSQSSENSIVSTANTAFIQAIIALIDTATPLGLLQVQPPIPTNADYNAISAYFTSLGYAVNINLSPVPFFGQGSNPINTFNTFWNISAPPPAYPSPGWAQWQIYVQRHHPRITISWGPANTFSFLLLESGDLFLLEDGIDGILLE